MLKEWIEECKKDPEYVYELLKDQLAVQLKALMEEKGITKKELARRMGVSPNHLNNVFAGEKLSLKTVARILVALGEDNVLLYLQKEGRNGI
jgi:transcriptional regulator with XRE-family HTH domain